MVSTRPSRAKGQLKRTASKSGRGSAPSVTPKGKAAAKTPASNGAKKTPKSTPKAEPEASGSRSTPKSDKKEKKVRVWWPPTKDKRKTQYSGAYWPATVIRKYDKGYEVKYDNGYIERVDKENVGPYSPPVPFGEEKTPLQEFEFCEVHNGSKTDPAAWFGCVDSVEDKGYRINYPFHDSSPEIIKPERVRRARVWDRSVKEWLVVRPYQEWDDGEVASPTELELIPEKELSKVLKQGPPAEFQARARSKKKKGRGESSTRKAKEPAKRGRKKKEPEVTAEEEEEEEGEEEEEEEEVPEEKPAKRRKVDKGKAKAKQESAAAAPRSPPRFPPELAANLMANLPGSRLMSAWIPGTAPGSSDVWLVGPADVFPSLLAGATVPAATFLSQPATSTAAAAAPASAVLPTSSALPAAASLPAAAAPAAQAAQAAAGPSKPPPSFGEEAAAQGLGAAGTDAEVSESGEEKEKEKKKKKKDPNAPKRPITAYLVFVQRNRDKTLVEYLKGQPEGTVPAQPTNVELSRMVAAKWKEVGEEEKKVCEETAEKDRQRYLAEMAAYKPPEGLAEDEEEDDKEGKAKKDPNAPRKPATAYILFCKEFRKTVDTHKVSFTEATNKAADAWRLADPTTRTKYEALAAVDKDRYTREAADYRAKAQQHAAAAAAAAAPSASAAPAAAAAAAAPAAGAETRPPAAAAPHAGAPLVAGMKLPSALPAGLPAGFPGAGALPAMFRFPGTAAPFQMFTMPSSQGKALGGGLDAEAADILANGLDMKKARVALARLYTHDAFHMLLDVWRENSPKMGDAIRSFKQNVKGYQRPDWKGFMIGIFGLEKMQALRKAPMVPLSTGPAGPSSGAKAATGDVPQTSSTPPSVEEGGEPEVGEAEGEEAEGAEVAKKTGEEEGHVSS